jgi:thymidylate synthase ThyX
MIEVNPVLLSKYNGTKIATLEVKVPYHTWIHLLTHRAFSRNAQSSRGIPFTRLLERATYIPESFPINKPGMSPENYIDKTHPDYQTLCNLWIKARTLAIETANTMYLHEVHKEIINRVIQPYCYITGIITATDWDNFIELRTASSTQEDTRKVAIRVREIINDMQFMNQMWHIPYVDTMNEKMPINDSLLISAARCARVSYLNHNNEKNNHEKDMKLANQLLTDKHMSPFEHQACGYKGKYYNLSNWLSQRFIIESEKKVDQHD